MIPSWSDSDSIQQMERERRGDAGLFFFGVLLALSAAIFGLAAYGLGHALGVWLCCAG